MPTFTFHNVSVTVTDFGTDTPPWGTRSVHRYKVTVKAPGGRYTTDAWGSISDTNAGKRDRVGIAATVLDELLSAAADPSEFIEMCMGSATGLEARRKARTAEKTVAAAKKIGFGVLEAATDEARNRGLL